MRRTLLFLDINSSDPSLLAVSKGSAGGGATYSSSELHLDRVSMPFSCARPAPNGTSTPQWVLGGSEVNLSSLARY